MITEDYVSFETAKLLNEKGFNLDECEVHYDPYNHQEYEITLQMAMKWLRKEHNIHIVPKFDFYSGDYTGRIYDGRRESTVEKDDYIALVGNSTYEEAAEVAIKYCLENLI